MASKHNAPSCWAEPMFLSGMSYLLLRKSLQPCLIFQQMNHELSVQAHTPKNTVFYNEAANVIIKSQLR